MGNREKNAGFALGVLFAINLLNFYDRQIFGAVAEPIRHEWNLTDSQVGWLGTAFTLLYAAVGVPLGRLSDRWKRPMLLSAGVAFWSVLTAASGFAWNFWTLFAARLGVGIGEASCAPASNSLIGDFYPALRRARALSFFMLGLPIGNFLGNLLSGEVAHAFGWRSAFYIACIPGILLAALTLRIFEPQRGAAENSLVAARRQEGSPYWRILRIPTMRWIIISGAFMNFNAYAIGMFLPAYLIRYHGLNIKEANVVAALAYGAVGVPGLLLGGWVADHIHRRRRDGRLLLSAAALLVATPCMLLALNRPAGDVAVFAVLMGTGYMLCYVYYSGVYAAIQDVVEPGLRGTAMAIYFFAMYMLGGSFGPLLTGKLSDYYASRAMAAAGATSLTEVFRAAGLHSAMYIIPACSFILFAVLLAASRTVAADMHEMQSGMKEPRARVPIPVEALGPESD
jgi:MFS family permease